MTSPARLPRRPEARTEKVEDLVQRVAKGQVRVPRFQRGLKWTSDNVVELFDSLYRGYPVGSLLFYKGKADATVIDVGPLKVSTEETAEAWWVVDGQQRVTSLTAALRHATPLPGRPSRDDPYVLFFNPVDQRFQPPPPVGEVPSEWVPLPQLLDSSQLSEWIFSWPHAQDAELRRTVFEAGTRIRDYEIPLYLIETEDAAVAEVIFYRTNKAGRPLGWKDVHKALFGQPHGSPSTLEELADELVEVGMGRLEETRLLTCLVACRGKDPTRTLDEHLRRDPEVLRGAVQEALPVLRKVLSFLRADAQVPHSRLLPKSTLLDVLTRFFALHPDPKPRSRTLLARWFWRAALGAGRFDDRTLRRRGISSVSEDRDEEDTVQALLGLLERDRQRPYDLPQSFDARADATRLAMLTLAHQKPRSFVDATMIDVATLFEQEDREAFRQILTGRQAKDTRGVANYLLQPRGVRVLDALRSQLSYDTSGRLLDSHLIAPVAATALANQDWQSFLDHRARLLLTETRKLTDRLAAWEQNDRPSIGHILEAAGVEL